MELAWGREDVIHLEIGEPGFDTPANVQRAAADAAAKGHTHYSPTPGLPELREALVEKIRTVNKIAVSGPDEVIVTNGGCNALFSIFGSILDPGDSILLPNPGWSNFPMMAVAFGANADFYSLDASTGYMPDLEELESLVHPGTRALVLNSPSNPLGAVMGREVAERLYAFCEEKDIWIISDECYDGIDFSGKFFSIGSLETVPTRVATVFSFSKVYAMTGWRVGYCALPTGLANAVVGLQQPTVMCVNTPAQYAALEAITGTQDHLEGWVDLYRENRDVLIDQVKGSRLSAWNPDGGFYVWLDVRQCGMTSEDFALRALEEVGVVLTPGSAFGSLGEGFVRLSLATSRANLIEGIDRLLSWDAVRR